jgi:hypothetical protein
MLAKDYENHTETPISDAVYEFGLSNLFNLMKEFPKEWEECPLHPEYFLDQELGWKSTSMGSPVCNLVQEEADRLLYIGSSKE